ncbi:N-acetyl-gamma-glutamyl-phosphate reductase [Verrucomicrobia bacterium SCGC AG-212-E04]|nr:N-acetyl-gamma-glutamyl-phosphate reductase [Verrucomicrobia bacterium SCGC AG-212-E04]
MEERVKVAVVGASGYSGEELVGLLLRHPRADLVCVTSRAEAGRRLDEVYPRFRDSRHATLPVFTAPAVETIVKSGASFVFLALPHGLAAEFAAPLAAAGLRVIDLSADFRLRDAAVYREFYGHEHPAPALLAGAVYGLPELRRAEIVAARLVAAPGCYPTSVLVPLVPLLRRKLLDPAQILVSSISGVSGAGRKAEVALLFSELNESAKPYGSPKHRHLSEMEQELSLAAGQRVVINFTPHLIPITRGIVTTIYATPNRGIEPAQIGAAWGEAYGSEPFVRIITGDDRLPEIRHVANTNFIDLAWRHDPRTGRVILFSAEDNLVKGASGQAVQCFNLMAGFPETAGL